MDFNQVDVVYIEYRYSTNDATNFYAEVRDRRVINPAGDVMQITVYNKDAAEDEAPYQLVFSHSGADEILVKGDFFQNVSEIYKTTPPVFDPIDYCSFELDFDDDEDDEKMLIAFELHEGKVRQISPVTAITTKKSPMVAKAYKDDFNKLTTALAGKEHQYRDANGNFRVYIKFLNGRTVQIEHASLMSDDDVASVFYIHECSHLDIKRYWTTVSSVIIFSTAFKFSFPDKNGNEVDLILRRCPDDEHIADEFCSDILTGMQMELESMLDDELKDTMKRGFERLEKLIKQGNSNSASKSPTTRVAERLVKPAKKSPSKI